MPSLAWACSVCWHNCRRLSRMLRQMVLLRSLGRVFYVVFVLNCCVYCCTIVLINIPIGYYTEYMLCLVICMHCLGIDVGECLEPQFEEWSQFCGVEPIVDSGDVLGCTESLSKLCARAGALKREFRFRLNELEPSTFVANIVTKGYS